MKSIYKKTFLLFTLCSTLICVSSQTTVDYDTLSNRLYKSLYFPVGSYDLNNLNSDGSFKNVTYPTIQPTDNTGDPRSHLYEMGTISNAYQTVGLQYKSPALLDAYCKAWNWWFLNNPTDTNWWWRSIGWPNTLYPSFVLMAKDMKTYYPTEYLTIVNYLLSEWTPEKVAVYKSDPDGANTSDITYYTMATAIATENDSIINQTCDVLNNLINIRTTPHGEGIQPDYSFSQHASTGRQLYLGNYGKEYIGGIVRFLTLTDNTFFEIPAEKMTIFENLFLEGVSWVAYRNIFDHHQHGRRVVITDGYAKSLACLNILIDLNTPQKLKLQELSAWMSRSYDSSEINIQQGNRMYWRLDYMVHKGKNYFTSNRMTSTRTLCSESANGEGLNNYYTGSGVNYLYITGQEYLEIWDDMNWRRLPGITAPQKPMSTTLPLVPPNKTTGLNGDAYAGGTSDGKTGVSGFKYNKVHATEINVTSNKSVFYQGDYYVVLGANVKAGKNYGVPFATTINQVKFKDNFVVDNNGSTQSITNGQALAPATSNWAFLNNVGYQFITNTKLNFEVKTVGVSPIAWMAFNHGNQPTNDNYAYAVYPNISQNDFMNKMQQSPFIVVANNAYKQCVVDTESKIAQIVFFVAGKIDLPGEMGSVESDQPAVLQLRWKNDSVYVNMANPYCESRNVYNLKLTISGLYEGESTTILDEQNNLTVFSSPMPLNEFQGSTVTVGLKKKAISGLDLPSSTKFDMNLFPNTLKAGTSCSFLTSDKSPVKVTIFNNTGLIIRDFESTPDLSNRIWIDTKGLNPNLYFVRCNSSTGKIIVY